MEKRWVIITYCVSFLVIGALIGISGVLNLISYFTSLEDFIYSFYYFPVGMLEIWWVPVYLIVGVYGLLYVEINIDEADIDDPNKLVSIGVRKRRKKTAEWFYNLQHNMCMFMFFVFIFQFFGECLYLEVFSLRWTLFLIFVIIGVFTAAAQDRIYRKVKRGQSSSNMRLVVYYGSNVYYMIVYAIAALNVFSLIAAIIFSILEGIVFVYVINKLITEKKLKGDNTGNKQF